MEHIGIKGDAISVVGQLEVSPQLIILDPPFETNGTKGGNRHISRFPVIDAKTFGDICGAIPIGGPTFVALIFTLGKKSDKARKSFISEVKDRMGVGLVGEFRYTKIDSSGKRMTFGKYTMPDEGIYIFSNGSTIDTNLNISTQRPPRGAYPTQKPEALIQMLVENLTQEGDCVLDPFAGSGTTYAVCKQMMRSSVSVDICHNPIDYRDNKEPMRALF